MKRKLLASILGIAAATAIFNTGNVATAQGQIYLDTYNTSPAAPYPAITYGANSGGTLNAGILGGQGFTVGFYYSSTPLTAAATTSGNMDFSTPGGTLAVGAGSTGLFNTTPAYAGLFTVSPDAFTVIPGVAAGNTVYLVVVAYNGANYASSLVRGHSAAFQLTAASAPPIAGMGGSPGPMGAFQVVGVPEPSTFALAGLGLAGLLIFRRRK